MDTWNFTLAIDDRDLKDDASWDDIPNVVGTRWMNRLSLVDFAIEAETLDDAVSLAISGVKNLGGRTVKLEPDDLVDLQELAHYSRLGWSRMHAFANSNSKNPMPLPIRRVDSERPLWSWKAVSAWLAENGLLPDSDARFAASAFEINRRIEEMAASQSGSQIVYDSLPAP